MNQILMFFRRLRDKGFSFRRLLFVILVLGSSWIAYVSGLLGDTNYEFTFTPNIEADMSHYNLYIWEGLDTTLCPFFHQMPIMPTHSTFNKQIAYTSSLNEGFWSGVEDGKTYYSILLQAVDNNGNLSGASWGVVDGTNSHFRLSNDDEAPAVPKDLKIRQ